MTPPRTHTQQPTQTDRLHSPAGPAEPLNYTRLYKGTVTVVFPQGLAARIELYRQRSLDRLSLRN